MHREQKMTRVRLKHNPDVTGTIVDGTAQPGDVCVHWDDDDSDQTYRINYSQLETIKEKPDNIYLSLLDALDRLRDSFNLALECIERDIRREMKKEEQRR
jgi:hypothetical protein